MIKVIIFDLGGVILKHRSDLIGYIISEIFSLPLEEGMKLWKQYRIRLLKGEFSSKDFLNKLNSTFKTRYSLNELLKMWKDLYVKNSGIDQDVLDFVDRLKKKYKVYLLTDTIDIHDEYNKTRGIYDKFTKVFKSYEEKLAKAEGKEFYLDVLHKINAKPYECIFIDDLEEQVKTAKSLGAKGIVFKNLSQLKENLYRLGVQNY